MRLQFSMMHVNPLPKIHAKPADVATDKHGMHILYIPLMHANSLNRALSILFEANYSLPGSMWRNI